MELPRVKTPHTPARTASGNIRLGGWIYTIASETADPQGWIWAMLELLDGTRTIPEIVAKMSERFPEFTREELRDGLEQLMSTGYLEDAAKPPPAELTASELDRYSRSAALYEWMDLRPGSTRWDPQVALRRANVVLVGVGGTGGSAALALVASGVGRLHCVEPDVVEVSNLNRQILYGERDVGRPKVEAAVEHLRDLNSGVEVTGERAEIRGPEDFARVCAGRNLLVLAGDRPAEIRSWANAACLMSGVPWVHAVYYGPQVTIGTFRPGTGPCYECVRVTDEQRQERTAYLPAHGPQTHAANAVSAMMSGTMLAHAAMSLITGAPRLPGNAISALNLAAPDHAFTVTADGPRTDCLACAGAG
ncbi:dinucleotide-utilizing protein [Nonomuraea mesophila]|uniref:Dinucleotide-utilizing protein n=1 Tax=Nonomuraea mesophila TaxID=2530382 RepID=A0A4R5FYM4_9ACTN|nr:ThiF family adenylyltransferase [Nonomuraea mesophila]TDE60309.1 dinucleotide-utilizing protein [Nonomuraea mesophila]